MRYTKEERLEIGRKVDERTMSRYEAAEAYGISDDTARDYMRMHRDSNSLPNPRGTTQAAMFTKVIVTFTPSILLNTNTTNKYL